MIFIRVIVIFVKKCVFSKTNVKNLQDSAKKQLSKTTIVVALWTNKNGHNNYGDYVTQPDSNSDQLNDDDLKNQEEAIYTYLEPIIEIIKEKGTFKTKPLDGILVHIALKKLRDEFPDKYVAVKTNVRGDKYVLVNEYRAREI